MPARLTEPVVLDATVPSNVASGGAVGWLVDRLDARAVHPAVVAEIERGREHGREFLDDAAVTTFPAGGRRPVDGVFDAHGALGPPVSRTRPGRRALRSRRRWR